MRYFLLLSLFSIHYFGWSQNLTFTDSNLKAYLIHELSVDINGDNLPDTSVDLNGDSEIQVTEALQVNNLVIASNNTQSVQDLSQFQNLKRLTIKSGAISEIANLGLNQLTYLSVTDITDMTNVDLSDLPNLKSIILESLYRLKHLNLENGSMLQNTFRCFIQILWNRPV